MSRSRVASIASLSLLGLIGLSLVGCSLWGTPQDDRNKEDALLHLKMGTTLFTNKQYPAALRELLIAEKLDPKNAVVQNNLALTYFVRERFDIAQKHIENALALEPGYTEARNNRSRILIERGQYDEAIAEAKRVVADLTYATPIRGWTNIALAQFKKGQYELCRKTATEALRVDRQNCFAQTLLGRSLLELKEYKDAAETLDRATVACESDGSDEAGYFAGFAHYKLGQASAAAARLESVVKNFPQGRYAKKAESLLEIIK